MFTSSILQCVTKLQLLICWLTVSFLICVTSTFEDSFQERSILISENHGSYLSDTNEIDLLKRECEIASFKKSHDEDSSYSLFSSQQIPEFTYSKLNIF